MPDHQAIENSFVDTLTGLFAREGFVFTDDIDLHRERIRWELRSGQWVLMTKPDTELFWGFMSWYLLDDERLALLNDRGLDDLCRNNVPFRIDRGEHVYISTAIVAPWAPKPVYRQLYNLVKEANRSANDVSGHFHKRDGRVIYRTRPIKVAA